MPNLPEEIKQLKNDIATLMRKAIAVEKSLANIKGQPVIQAYQGMQFVLNGRLNVVELLKRLGDLESGVTGGSGNGTSVEVGHSHDHGDLTGRDDDDHSIYFLADGTRQLSGDLDIATSKVIKIDSTQVVGAQQAYIADAATDASESHTITDPGDSPASADALRDDLVANTVPAIESAFDALGAKVNAVATVLNSVITALELHGLISDSALWARGSALAIASKGLINPSANSYGLGISTRGIWDVS